MIKIALGIFIGVAFVHFNLLPTIVEGFVSSGARDGVVDFLKEIRS
tara:strand:- start:3039 stop:3176 length:138 start_codon:yes stop_codon:yes gene_type:complete